MKPKQVKGFIIMRYYRANEDTGKYKNIGIHLIYG